MKHEPTNNDMRSLIISIMIVFVITIGFAVVSRAMIARAATQSAVNSVDSLCETCA